MTSDRTSRRRKAFGPAVSYYLPLFALWAVAGVVALFSTPLGLIQEQQAIVDPPPSISEAGTVEDSAEVAVEAQVQYEVATELFVRGGGIVTEIAVAPGAPLTRGQQLLRLDNVLVRAQVGGAPLTVDVSSTSSGNDVNKTSAMLADIGYLASAAVGPNYTRALRQAIDRWNVEASLPKDGIFRVSSAVFVPAPSPILGALEIQVGERVEAESSIGQLAPGVNSISLTPTPEGGGSLSVFESRALVFQAGDGTIELPNIVVGGDQTQALASFLSDAALRGDLQALRSEDSVTFTGGSVSLSEPLVSAAVPNSAIYVGVEGAQCIYEVTSLRSPISSAREVRIIGGRPLAASTGTTSIPATYAGTFLVTDISLLDLSINSCK